jgi:segregation and condensation protein B
MSSKRTRRKSEAAAEATAPAAVERDRDDETDLAEVGFDEEGGEPLSAGEADASVERLEDSLDALDAEVGEDTSDEDAARGFDTDPAGGLEAADEDEPDAEAEEEITAEDENADAEEEDEEAEADDDIEDDDDDDDDEAGDVVIFDADAEDREEELARRAAELKAAAEAGAVEGETAEDEVAPGGKPREMAELVAVCEALIFVSEEPMTTKALADVLGEDKGWVQVALEQLASEFNERNGGLMLREVAGGWQFATRPEHHEHIRAYLKSKPSAKLSLAALETLAVIAYKQPVTVPEILEIRGVQSSSAIKTLLDKRLIVAKGRKEVVGRPMMYGTSKEFLLQFGLRDLSELPSIEDFEDLTTGES